MRFLKDLGWRRSFRSNAQELQRGLYWFSDFGLYLIDQESKMRAVEPDQVLEEVNRRIDRLPDLGLKREFFKEIAVRVRDSAVKVETFVNLISSVGSITKRLGDAEPICF